MIAHRQTRKSSHRGGQYTVSVYERQSMTGGHPWWGWEICRGVETIACGETRRGELEALQCARAVVKVLSTHTHPVEIPASVLADLSHTEAQILSEQLMARSRLP